MNIVTVDAIMLMEICCCCLARLEIFSKFLVIILNFQVEEELLTLFTHCHIKKDVNNYCDAFVFKENQVSIGNWQFFCMG